MWGLKVKGQGHWERKCSIHFSRICLSKVDRFIYVKLRPKRSDGPLYTYHRIHFVSGNASIFRWFLCWPTCFGSHYLSTFRTLPLAVQFFSVNCCPTCICQFISRGYSTIMHCTHFWLLTELLIRCLCVCVLCVECSLSTWTCSTLVFVSSLILLSRL